MSWEQLATEPLDIDSGVLAPRARAITSALARLAVPVLALRNGRAEPLASGALYDYGTSLLLLTCRHLFDDGAAVGDLGLPLGDTRRILWLRDARPIVLVDPQADLAAVRIGCRRSAGLLRRHWRVAALDRLAAAGRTQVYVLAGFPYAQMRRVGPTLHAKPVVVFACGRMEQGRLQLNYQRIARRARDAGPNRRRFRFFPASDRSWPAAAASGPRVRSSGAFATTRARADFAPPRPGHCVLFQGSLLPLAGRRRGFAKHASRRRSGRALQGAHSGAGGEGRKSR